MSVFIRRWHLYCQNSEQVPEQLIQDSINGVAGRKDEHTMRQHFSLNGVKKEMGDEICVPWTELGADLLQSSSVAHWGWELTPELEPASEHHRPLSRASPHLGHILWDDQTGMCWEYGCDDWVGPSFSAFLYLFCMGFSDCTWSKSQLK